MHDARRHNYDDGEKPGGDLRVGVEVAENAGDDRGVHRIEDENGLSFGEHLRLIRPDRGVEGLRLDDFRLLGTRTAPIATHIRTPTRC